MDALLLVDAYPRLDHDDGAALGNALAVAAERMNVAAELARAAGVPVVFVTDAAGDWRGERSLLLEDRTAQSGAFDQLPRPDDEDVFLVKARYSALDHTPLDLILRGELGVARIVMAGTATEMCIAQTAIDGKELGYQVSVLRDACAATDDRLADISLEYLDRVVGAEVIAVSEWQPDGRSGTGVSDPGEVPDRDPDLERPR